MVFVYVYIKFIIIFVGVRIPETYRSRIAGSVVASDYVRLVSRSRRLQAESLTGMGLPGGARTRKRPVASGNKISVQFSSVQYRVLWV